MVEPLLTGNHGVQFVYVAHPYAVSALGHGVPALVLDNALGNNTPAPASVVVVYRVAGALRFIHMKLYRKPPAVPTQPQGLTRLMGIVK